MNDKANQSKSFANTKDNSKVKKNAMVVPIHFGKLTLTEYFTTYDNSIKKGDSLLIKSDRGSELGTALSKPILESEYKDEVFGRVIRHSRLTERSKAAEIPDGIEREMKFFCSTMSKELNLNLKIQDVEYLLGGERAIFYFTANGRVDFRQLVKNLASKFHTRIEMRQIGFRDNAKLFGGFGKCGLELCCTTFLKTYPEVTIKMAYLQKGSSESSKVTGQCGKLLCCLQYENDLYIELKRNLPNRGEVVETSSGSGEVINVDVLNQKITFVNDAKEYFTVEPKEVKKVTESRRKKNEQK
ncbi:MAG: hypothetical protein COA79_01210 [Planctomycetota bacterium]|nr:MAG: hypothetical protein COA79_01210 [Planctomycetota bacterium]